MKLFGKVASMTMVLVVSLVTLVGCQASEPVQEETPAVVIGTESADALSMSFVNATGKEITGVAMQQAGSMQEGGFATNLLTDATWASDSVALMYAENFSQQGETTSGDSVVLRPSYDIQLTFQDGTAAVLHAVTFEEASEVTVNLDAETTLAYLTYELDGSQASTLEAEKAVQAEEQAAAEAAAQAQAEAEAAAAEAAAAEQAAQEAASQAAATPDYSYDYSSSGSGDASSSGSQAAPSQSEDVCVDDVILR